MAVPSLCPVYVSLSPSPLRACDQVGPGYDTPDVLVPGIPALDLVCAAPTGPSHDTSDWPEFLRQPLVKVAPEAPEAAKDGEAPPKAVASGVRSALVKLDGVWYRLKGCGNNTEGFTVRESRGQHGTWRDVRGACVVRWMWCA